MAFTYADVLEAKRWRERYAPEEEALAAVEQGPLGYRSGGRVSYTNNNFVVAPFVMNVNGHMVSQKTSAVIAADSWGRGGLVKTLRVPGMYYYLYVGGDGVFYVTANAPRWDVGLMAWYHQDTGERLLGLCFLDVNTGDFDSSGEMIYASSQLEVDTHEVTVVASDYVGEDYDYRCDGVADEEEINHAIRYMARSKGKDIGNNELPGGGIVRLSPGAFNLVAPIQLMANVLLEGSGKSTVLDPAAGSSAIEVIGISSDDADPGLEAPIVGSGIRDLKIKRSDAPSYPGGASETNYLDDIRLQDTDRFVVSSVECDDDVARSNAAPEVNVYSYASVRAKDCDDLVVRGCDLQIGTTGIVVEDCTGLLEANNIWMSAPAAKKYVTGIIVVDSTKMRVEGNKISDLISSHADSANLYAIHVLEGGGGIIKRNMIENLRLTASTNTTLMGGIAISPHTVAGGLAAEVTGNVIRTIHNWVGPGVSAPNSNTGVGISLAANSHDTIISNNHIEHADAGIQVTSSARVELSGNYVRECGQLIANGNCERPEADDAPLLMADYAATPSSPNSTWVRSNEQAHEGSYSYKITKSGAGDADAQFHDGTGTTDMHGLILGTEYTLEAWFYVPSSGGPSSLTYVELWLSVYVSGSWAGSYARPLAYNAWQKLSATLALASAATGTRLGVRMDSAASAGEYFYVDDIRLYPTKHQNVHENLLRDGGTDTRF